MPGEATIPAMRMISSYSSSLRGEMIRRTFLRNFTLRRARLALHGAQVRHQTLPIRVERIGIGVASDFGERVEGALRRAVIAEHAIAAAHLLELPQCVGLLAGATPHLLAFDEQSIPVVVVRVHTEEPVTALGWRTSHG